MISTRKIVSLILLLAALSLTLYIVIIVVPSTLAKKSYEGAKQIGRDINKALHFTPEIAVNNTVVLQQQSPILELATVSQKFQHQYDWVNTWMGSTKKIFISGIFEAKAGYNLHKKFTININKDKATVILPNPEILSVELVGDVKFNDEHGVWNWVNPTDRSQAINGFQQNARKYAREGDFINQAKINMEDKLTEILQLHGKKVKILFYDETPIINLSK